jgi:hypothetical protein
MRYVVLAVVVLVYMGMLFSIAPFGVLMTWGVVVVLAASGINGARRGNRPRTLQRVIFLNDSLIGYKESVDDEHKRGSRS